MPPAVLPVTPETVLRHMVLRAPATVRGCAAATSSIWRGGVSRQHVVSHPELSALTRLERRVDATPNNAAAAGVSGLSIVDTATDLRWPEFCSLALRLAIRCSTTVVSELSGQVVTLTLYGLRPGALAEHSAALGVAIVDEGLSRLGRLTAYDGARREAHHLGTAMAIRDVVEQAKGMIMQGTGCTADTAFDELARISQHGHLKIVDVARRLVEQNGPGPGVIDPAGVVVT